MTTTKEEVTKEVVKAFDDYYYERFWYDLNDPDVGEPMSKKAKTAVDELVEKKLEGDETLSIALGAVDYYILKCDDEVLGDDNGRTLFVKEIHERAKIWKAKYAQDDVGLFDAVAIGAALKVKANDESDRSQKRF